LPENRAINHVEVQDTGRVREVLDTVNPDVVINGVGIVKQRDKVKQAIPSIQVDALFA
jgi:dTDP-4-dehydrorhamnose reductase